MGEPTNEQQTAPQPKPLNTRTEKINYDRIINYVLAVFGIALTIYIFVATTEKRELTYYVSSTRTAIVQKGNLNNFSVNYQGVAITGALSSAEIQIWNAGKREIRGGDITNGGDIEKTITLHLPNGEPIYTATETNSRTEIGFVWSSDIDKPPNDEKLNWNILEQNDCIKVQIIYGGDVSAPITVTGSILGQSKIVQYQKDKKNYPKTYYSFYFLFVIVGGSFLINIINVVVQRFCKNVPLELKLNIQLLKSNFQFLTIAILVWAYPHIVNLLFPSTKPPFGF